jgi:hypothetical protein
MEIEKMDSYDYIKEEKTPNRRNKITTAIIISVIIILGQLTFFYFVESIREPENKITITVAEKYHVLSNDKENCLIVRSRYYLGTPERTGLDLRIEYLDNEMNKLLVKPEETEKLK